MIRSGAGRRAFLTIVSANYLAAARVLCRSLAEHHPEARRFVILVDRAEGSGLRSDEPFETILADALGIPDFDAFTAQYTVMEANTAVKPFAMQHLLLRGDVEQLVYLDPDIWVHAPLTAVFDALCHANLVLTPHLRDPFRDHERPSEYEILRAGAYNLGFAAVRKGEAADKLLSWWAEKTEHDCVIDLANGLFVDQKWMDLAPGYVPNTEILRDPCYNVAYWNLHERELTEKNGRWFVDGEPLSFFHFSGYDPGRPLVFSKHQSRHHLRGERALTRLCDAYAARLVAEGHEHARTKAYAFCALSNGVPLSAPLRHLVRTLRKRGVSHPPVSDADAFCRFLMTPNAEVSGTEIAPFVAAILDCRPDVVAAYPTARHDARNVHFLHWLDHSAHECDAVQLVERFRGELTKVNVYDRVAELYDRRPDLQAAYPDAFRTMDGLTEFGSWLLQYGETEAAISPEATAEFVAAGRTALEDVLDLYFSSPDLQEKYPLALLPCGDDFYEWLLRNGARVAGLSTVQCGWFRRRVRELDVSSMLVLTALRGSWTNVRFPLGATVYGWAELALWARAWARERGHEIGPLKRQLPRLVPPLSQIEAVHATAAYFSRHPDPFRTRASLSGLVDSMMVSLNDRLELDEREELKRAIQNYTPARGVNIAGHFHYAAGVGSAARSLAMVLDAAGISHHDVTLPVPPSRMSSAPRTNEVLPRRFWDLHRPDFDVAITVANADVARAARSYLGPSFESHRRRIGYWVWETDKLPGEYAPAAEAFDEIWTPSEYSAKSLRNTLGDSARIEVVPYSVALHAPTDPREHPVVLPEGRTLFGFCFDTRSVVERKNPGAVLRAFRAAFRADDRVTLVLKVSHGGAAPREMRELERLAEGLPVVWLRDVRLDDFQMRTFLSRLDVYVSLHRLEGFGLVLAEAMAMATPVVATGFSGNLEFMDPSSARIVSYREVKTERSYGPYPRGIRWAEPDIEQAAHLLRELHEDAELRKDLGARGRARIEATLAPWIVARTVTRLLSDPGGGPSGGAASRDKRTLETRAPLERPHEAQRPIGRASPLPGE